MLLASCVLAARGAAQTARPTVAVILAPSCAHLDPEVIDRVLDVELGETIERLDPEGASARVEVACADPIYALTLTERGTERRRARELEVPAQPGRSRLVALAVSELIAASYLPPSLDAPSAPSDVTPPDEVVPDPPPIGEPAPAPEAPRAAPIGARVFGVGRISGEPFHFSLGGGVGFDALLASPLALVMDARVERGSIDVATVGVVDLTGATLGAFAALRADFDRSHADMGLGVRGGVGVLEGRGTDGLGARTVVGPTLAIAGTTVLSFHLAGTGFVHVGLELGWTLVTVSGVVGASTDPIARLGGAYLSISLGFEIRP